MILVWIHNALCPDPYQGLPLPPEGYQDLMGKMPHRLIADSKVLNRYLKKQGPALKHSIKARDLAEEPLLSVVASDREEMFQDYGTFKDWPHAKGRLGLNPMYVADPVDERGELFLSRRFPSAIYEAEHKECKAYLPERVKIHSSILDDLRHAKRTQDMESLIDRCICVGVS
jgi:hypothetical protein